VVLVLLHFGLQLWVVRRSFAALVTPPLCHPLLLSFRSEAEESASSCLSFRSEAEESASSCLPFRHYCHSAALVIPQRSGGICIFFFVIPPLCHSAAKRRNLHFLVAIPQSPKCRPLRDDKEKLVGR
jgi:hypothetical protein